MPTSIQWCSCACHYLDPRKLFEWFRDKWMYPSWLSGMKGVNWSEVIIIVPGQIKFSQGTLPLLKWLEMTWRRFTSIILLSLLQQWSRNAVSIIHSDWHGLHGIAELGIVNEGIYESTIEQLSDLNLLVWATEEECSRHLGGMQPLIHQLQAARTLLTLMWMTASSPEKMLFWELQKQLL